MAFEDSPSAKKIQETSQIKNHCPNISEKKIFGTCRCASSLLPEKKLSTFSNCKFYIRRIWTMGHMYFGVVFFAVVLAVAFLWSVSLRWGRKNCSKFLTSAWHGVLGYRLSSNGRCLVVAKDVRTILFNPSVGSTLPWHAMTLEYPIFFESPPPFRDVLAVWFQPPQPKSTVRIKEFPGENPALSETPLRSAHLLAPRLDDDPS